MANPAALPQLPSRLNTTPTVANLSAALCFIGPAVMPLYWSAMLENSGRRIVYLLSLALFVLFSGLAISASSITSLIITRILASFCGCAPTVAGAAVVADLWDVKERGYAMSIYYLGPLAGPAIGPIIGGVLTQVWDWRADQWFLTVYAGVMLATILFFLPETLRVPRVPAALPEQSLEPPLGWESVTGASGDSRSRRSLRSLLKVFVDPMRAIAFLRFPAITLVIYLASICFGVVIMAATTLQQAFHAAPYRFSYLIIGLLFLPMSFGLILGGLISGRWSDHIMDREAKASERFNVTGAVVHVPEDRMKENAWTSVVLLPGALIWYGWTIHHGIIWIVPVNSLLDQARPVFEK